MKYCSSPGGNSFSLQITSKEMCTWREKPRDDLNACRSWGASSSPNKTTGTLVQCHHGDQNLLLFFSFFTIPASWNNLVQTFPSELWLHQIWNILDGFWLRRWFFSLPFLGRCLVIIGTTDLFGLSHQGRSYLLLFCCFFFLLKLLCQF